LPVASKLEEIINGRFQKIKKELLAQNKYTIDEKIDGKEYKIKFRSSKDGPSVYVRQYLAAGGFNRVERLIGLTGKEWETMWDVAYTKHRKDKAHSKPEKNSSPSSNNFPELAIAQRLHNAPFVLNYSPVYYRKDPTKIKATLSPFCNAGDLDSYIKQKTAHPIEDKLAIAIQLAKGIAEMHARGVVHVDLKPKNILLTSHGEERHVRIADFGLSCPVGTSKPFAGTITYAPPEQVEAKTAKIIMHAKKSLDVWAFGNILAELMYHHKINVFSSSKAAILQSENEELFQKYHDLRSIMKKIISGEPLPKAILQSGNKELFQKYYDEMRKLISKKPLPKTIKNDVNRTILTCLQLDPDERPEMPAVVRTLQKIRQTLIENMEQPS
jgi:serine/threonine protein kinase